MRGEGAAAPHAIGRPGGFRRSFSPIPPDKQEKRTLRPTFHSIILLTVLVYHSPLDYARLWLRFGGKAGKCPGFLRLFGGKAQRRVFAGHASVDILPQPFVFFYFSYNFSCKSEHSAKACFLPAAVQAAQGQKPQDCLPPSVLIVWMSMDKKERTVLFSSLHFPARRAESWNCEMMRAAPPYRAVSFCFSSFSALASPPAFARL